MGRPRKPIEKDDIAEDIRGLADELNRTPRANDFRDCIDDYSFRLIQLRFGTWNEALKYAGFEPNRPTKVAV